LAAQADEAAPPTDTVPAAEPTPEERKAARAAYMEQVKSGKFYITGLSWQEQELAKREYDASLPFAERTLYRTRHMYRGWQLEPVEVQAGNFAVTRSNYGYRVLNSPELGAVDVDFDFGAGISERHVPFQQMEALANIRDWVAAHPEQSWRVYRTAAGLRMIRTDAPQPLDEGFDAVTNAIDGADLLYGNLCEEQLAFRLRISPKVARIGADYPGWSPYDYENGGWLKGDEPTQAHILAYETKAQQYKVAQLIGVVGSGQVHPDLVAVLKYHDDQCRVESSLPMETPEPLEYFDVVSMGELIAFNGAYRPEGMAPEEVWRSLGEEQTLLRALDSDCFRNKVIFGGRRLDRLFHKWNRDEAAAKNYRTIDDVYDAALPKYKEGAARYTWVEDHWASSIQELQQWPEDSRYWTLDNPGEGNDTRSAIIRFLPSADNQRFVTKDTVGIIKHCVSNILVLKNPVHPENEGKVFLFRFDASIWGKIHDVGAPPPEFADIVPGDVFDWITGCNFKLRAFRYLGSVNLDKSGFDDPTPVGDDAFIADLRTKVYPLGASDPDPYAEPPTTKGIRVRSVENLHRYFS
jgi:hypothetical protein